MTDPQNDMLDDILAQARDLAPQPSDALMARVLADAAQMAMPATQIRRAGVWSRISDMLGGWPAVGGLAAATIAGIWVGIAPPASIETLAASVLGDTVTVSLFSADTIFMQGDFVDG